MTFGVNVIGASLQPLRSGNLTSHRTLPPHAAAPAGTAGWEGHVPGPPLSYHLAIFLRLVPIKHTLGLVQGHAAAAEAGARLDVRPEQAGVCSATAS